jgi:uncharacterized membrane protein (UPF0127 family)
MSASSERQQTVRLIRLRDQAVVTDRCDVAVSFVARLKGLLFRSGLAPGEGLLFPECKSVHMWGMRFSIDVVFLSHASRGTSGELCVSSVYDSIQPWRFLPVADFVATDALELSAGTVSRLGLKKGDVLCIS